MSEASESVMLTASIPGTLMERLQAETLRTARQLQMRPERARSTVVRLALADYLERRETEAAAPADRLTA